MYFDKDFEMEDQKIEWMRNNIQQNAYFAPSKFSNVFQIIKSDQQAQRIFLDNLKLLLSSKHSKVQQVLIYCLTQKKQTYFQIVTSFLRDYFVSKNPLFVSETMEKFIIMNVWKKNLRPHLKHIEISASDIIGFLCLKMRSLEPNIRLCALSSLIELIQLLKISDDIEMMESIKINLPQMIQKQTLSKNMSHIRGILLQILQDEICDIKTKGIELLGSSYHFFDIRTLRPLILYMLNDQHQLVRETALKVLATIHAFDLEKEDLKALLMCLKENNIRLRTNVYYNLMNINITSQQDFLLILEKLFQTLIIYKIDKKKIYQSCYTLGAKYPSFVLTNMTNIYQYSKMQEPNWKNLIYKAKLITLAGIGKDKWPDNLPAYFNNHYLYIKDIEYSVFDRNTSHQKYHKSYRISPNLILRSRLQLQHFINSSIEVTKGFTQAFLIILQKMLYYLNSNQNLWHYLESQILKLKVTYNIEKSPKCLQIMEQIMQIRFLKNAQKCLEKIEELALNISHQEEELNKIPQFIFKLSTHDRNCIVISKNQRIIQQCYIQFFVGRHSTSNQRSYFIKLSEIQFDDEDQQIYIYKIDFKWKSLKCFIIYSITDDHRDKKYLQIVTDCVSNIQ